MTARPPMRAAACGALTLRAWALGIVAGRAPTLPPAASAAAWDVFLAVDRCAHPLREALARADLLESLPEPARGALEHHGVLEAMSLLSLRQEAAFVGALLRARGWEGLVLKGGAGSLAGIRDVAVRDLDVLVRPEQARALAEDLDRAGFLREGDDMSTDAPNRHEMAPRKRPGGILVDVHFDLAPRLEGDPWAGSVPLAVRGLRRMAGPLHLWHVLLHGTLHHPERRGVLRDVLVAAAAVPWCTSAELDEVEARCAAHPRGRLAGRMLAMARALAAGRPDDGFRREAATAYLLYQLTARWHPPHPLLLALGRTAFALGEGRGEYRGLWYGSPVSAISRGYAGGRGLDRAFPAAAAVGRAAWRAANLLGAAVPGAWLARTALHVAGEG